MADHGDGASLHIAVFPWLAFGHMLPFLRLSKSLAKRRHRVSFLSTPRNIARLPKLPPDVAPFIDFVPLPLPPVEHLPADAESTNDLLLRDQIQYLMKALDGLQSPFECFLRSTKPDWVILDFYQHWAPPIAAELNVPCASLTILRAASLVFLQEKSTRMTSPPTPEELTEPPESVPFPTTMALSLHEAKSAIRLYRDNASGISIAQRTASVLKSSNFLAVRSCFELESSWLSLLAGRFCAGYVVPVGLLPTPADELASHAEEESSSSTTILRWLSEQEQLPRSVVYVAIGSEAALSAELEQELASGLELSAVPFLWAVRKPSGSGTSGGGGARRHCHGLVVECWAPQMEILRHNSVGAFLTHCGSSSVIESLEFGLPMVMLPSIADTGLIARWCTEMKVGEEVARNEADGSFTGEDVAMAIRKVIVEEEAKEFRRNAEKLQEVGVRIFCASEPPVPLCHSETTKLYTRIARVGPIAKPVETKAKIAISS